MQRTRRRLCSQIAEPPQSTHCVCMRGIARVCVRVRMYVYFDVCRFVCMHAHACMYARVTNVLSITRPLPLDHSFPPLTYTLPLSHALSMPVSAGGRVCRCQDPDTPYTCSFAVRARKFPCPLHIDCVRNVCVCMCVCVCVCARTHTHTHALVCVSVCVPARFTEPPSHARTLKRTRDVCAGIPGEMA